jgi:hypothetical protein
MTNLSNLSDELIVKVLTYLRSIDLASVREVNKEIFTSLRISNAINEQLRFVYTFPLTNQNRKDLGYFYSVLRPDTLFVKEVQCIIIALSSTQLIAGKGIKI